MICSLALARLRTDIKGNDLANSNAVGMAQKLLLFWRKPARRCWWEGVELDNVDGVEGKLKVWIRRVWTLEMVSFLVDEHVHALTTETERHRPSIKRVYLDWSWTYQRSERASGTSIYYYSTFIVPSEKSPTVIACFFGILLRIYFAVYFTQASRL